MAVASDAALEEIECDILESRHGARVAIRRAIRHEFDVLDDQKKGRLQAIMRLWCEGRALTPQMFNGNEGRSNAHNVMLQAFKTFKVRLYGFSSDVGGKRTFVIIDSDPAKKQDRADPKILKRAKRRIDELFNNRRGN